MEEGQISWPAEIRLSGTAGSLLVSWNEECKQNVNMSSGFQFPHPFSSRGGGSSFRDNVEWFLTHAWLQYCM